MAELGSEKQVLRFWSKVNKTETCWLWTAAMMGPAYKMRAGYGAVSAGGRRLAAHRASWEMANGPIPPGMFVCHRCDVPACVRPDHLFLGTQADNVRDRVAKGRSCVGARRVAASAHGEGQHASKLTTADVIELRRLRAETGMSFRSIGEQFGVGAPTAYKIVSGRAWRHVR